MSSSKDSLTTTEFAKKTGVSTSTVSKWLRAKKITGTKKGGKWLIASSEIAKVSAASPKKTAEAPQKKKPTAASPAKPKSGAKSYSIKEFSDLTYLTEYGVEKWLKEGRLVAAQDASGQPRVDAANLEHPAVKRLVR